MKTPVILSLFTFILSASCFSQEKIFTKFDYTTQPSKNVDIEKAEIAAGFTFLKNEKSEFKTSLSYSSTLFKDFDAFEFSEEDKRFNSVDYNLEYSYLLSENILMEFKINPSANFESNFGSSDISIFGGINVTKKLTESSKLSIGVQRSKIFGKPEILPTLNFLKHFQNDVDLNLGFPISKVSYSKTEQNVFSIENNFNGYFYNMDANNEINNIQTDRISFSQMSTAFQFDRKFDTNFTVSFKAGYDFNRKLKLTDSDDSVKYNYSISDGPNFKIGIKYQL